MKIYIVMQSQGEYADRSVYVDKVFTIKDEAEKYIESKKFDEDYYYLEEAEIEEGKDS